VREPTHPRLRHATLNPFWRVAALPFPLPFSRHAAPFAPCPAIPAGDRPGCARVLEAASSKCLSRSSSKCSNTTTGRDVCTSSTSRGQGQPAPEVKRVTPRGRSLRPKACGRPKACVADFLKEVRLPETSRRSSMCATALTYGRDDDLTHYLYTPSTCPSDLSYGYKVNPRWPRRWWPTPCSTLTAPGTLCARSSAEQLVQEVKSATTSSCCSCCSNFA